MQDIDTRDVEIRQLKECNVKLQEHAEQLSSDHKTILTTKHNSENIWKILKTKKELLILWKISSKFKKIYELNLYINWF